MKSLHRAAMLVTLGAVLTIAVLVILGVLPASEAWRPFLLIELPLMVVFVVLTVLRLRTLQREHPGERVIVLLSEDEPAIRYARAEFALLSAVPRLLLGRRLGVTDRVRGFDYAKGSMAVPIVLVGLTVVEALVLHLIVPWAWLRIVLLVAAVYSAVLVTGMLASRVINPHLVGEGGVHLRWGARTVMQIPSSAVAAATVAVDHRFAQPAVEGDRLVLTPGAGTNVRIELADELPADPPVWGRRRLGDWRAREVLLWVAAPEAFVDAIQRTRLQA